MKRKRRPYIGRLCCLFCFVRVYLFKGKVREVIAMPSTTPTTTEMIYPEPDSLEQVLDFLIIDDDLEWNGILVPRFPPMFVTSNTEKALYPSFRFAQPSERFAPEVVSPQRLLTGGCYGLYASLNWFAVGKMKR